MDVLDQKGGLPSAVPEFFQCVLMKICAFHVKMLSAFLETTSSHQYYTKCTNSEHLLSKNPTHP